MLEPNLRRPLLNTEIRRRGIYLLPNLFTTAALFAGFYAIVMAMNQRFDNAAVAIFVAMILDTLDGRVARLTHTQSAFGAEYDSLSDMVCFGAAPALVIYEWALKDLGRFGWIAAFVYCAGAALRLARFNTNIEVVDKRFFQRSEEHTSELQSHVNLVCRLLLEKKKNNVVFTSLLTKI